MGRELDRPGMDSNSTRPATALYKHTYIHYVHTHTHTYIHTHTHTLTNERLEFPVDQFHQLVVEQRSLLTQHLLILGEVKVHQRPHLTLQDRLISGHDY